MGLTNSQKENLELLKKIARTNDLTVHISKDGKILLKDKSGKSWNLPASLIE